MIKINCGKWFSNMEGCYIKLLRKCSLCGRYTLSEKACPECGGKTKNAHPARYSPEDKWGKYRRKLYLQKSESTLKEKSTEDSSIL